MATIHLAAGGGTGGTSGSGVPDDGSVTDVKVAANAAVSADKLADGTTKKVLTATERTKLTGVATGATANSSDATLLARANHTGTQSVSTLAVTGTPSSTTFLRGDGAWAATSGGSALTPGTGKNALTGVYYANGYTGIDSTGATDSTTGINTMFAAVPAGATIVFTGTYKINGPVNQPADGVTIRGTGYATVWNYTPAAAGTMMTITNAQRIDFDNIQFVLPTGATGAGSTLFKVSNSFAGSFTSCLFAGQHATAGDQYGVAGSHRGIYLTDNTGDWHFYNCHWNNLGTGLQTDCIQNSIVGGRFSLCYVGVYGFGSAGQPGMSITGYVDFVSFDDEPGVVTRNIWCPVTSNNWWISDVWAEGADTSIEFGDGAGTGPALVAIKNCHLAANTTNLKILGGQGTSLEDIYFNYSNGNTAAQSLQINGTYATSGFAKNLRSIAPADPARAGGNGVDLVSTVFPAGWTYIGTSRHRLTNELVGATDWVTDAGTKRAGVLSSGALIVDGATAGLVLRDSAGKYWRVGVSTAGALTVSSLTTTRPTA